MKLLKRITSGKGMGGEGRISEESRTEAFIICAHMQPVGLKVNVFLFFFFYFKK